MPMNSKTNIVFSAVAITAVVLLFGSSVLLPDHQALAYYHYHYHYGHYGHYGHYHYHYGHYGHYGHYRYHHHY